MFDWTTVYIVAAVLLVTAIAVAAAVAAQKRAATGRSRDPYVEGLIALVRGDRDSAFSLLQRAVRGGRAPVDAYVRVGELLRENGDAGKALQIHKSLTVKPDLDRGQKIELFTNIAMDYSAMGQSAQAVKVLETAVKTMGLKDPAIYELLARENHILGRSDDAYRYLKEMKKSGVLGERELSLYLCTAGEKKADENDLKEARKLVQRALRHDPSNGYAYLTLGNIEEKLGNDDAAVGNWRKAANSEPELSAAALTNLERVLFQSGTFGDIEKIYREVLEKRPWDEHATLALASFYRKQGRGGEAIESLEEYRSMHPESVAATALLTSLYAMLRDRDELGRFLEANEMDIAARAPSYRCSSCEFTSHTKRWHCPRCNAFDSFRKHDEN